MTSICILENAKVKWWREQKTLLHSTALLQEFWHFLLDVHTSHSYLRQAGFILVISTGGINYFRTLLKTIVAIWAWQAVIGCHSSYHKYCFGSGKA